MLVAPANPAAGRPEVKVSDADDEEGDAEIQQRSRDREGVSADQFRAFDLARISSDLRAVAVENLGSAAQVLTVGEGVPDVSVPSDPAIASVVRLTRRSAAESVDRGRSEVVQSTTDPHHPVLEVLDAAGKGSEFIAILDVVALFEAAAEPQDRPAAGYMIDGTRHVGDQIQVAVADAVDQRTKRDTRRAGRLRGQHRPTLKARHIRVSRAKEMVPVKQRIGAQSLGLAHGVNERRRARAILPDLKPDSNRSPTL